MCQKEEISNYGIPRPRVDLKIVATNCKQKRSCTVEVCSFGFLSRAECTYLQWELIEKESIQILDVFSSGREITTTSLVYQLIEIMAIQVLL